MKKFIIFLAFATFLSLIGYPFYSELIQLRTVTKSKSRFQNTVIENNRNQRNPVLRTKNSWTTIPGPVRQRLDELGFYPATLPEGNEKFNLETLDGSVVELEKYRGNWVLINFWATWCPPCRTEMPSLDQLQNKFANRPLTILTVNIQQEPDTIRQFRNNYGFSLPVLMDHSGDVAKRYGIVGLPETWLLTPDGRPAAKIDGPLDWVSKKVTRSMDQLTKAETSPTQLDH